MAIDKSGVSAGLAGRLLAAAAGAKRGVFRLFDRWSDVGTAGYATEDRRRLKILNLIAALIVVTTGIYSVQNTFMDFERFKPIIIINAAMLLVALAIPLLHRFGPIVAALTLVACEYVTLFALSAYLGRNAGLHLQYFVVAAATFVVLGFERLRLIAVITVAGLALHLVVWFRFPPEAALVPGIANDAAVTDGLYVQAAITTMALIAATVWYAFGLVEQARGETETLLRNVLPGSVVERLKASPGQSIADSFEDASVLFADISGFVPLARELGAEKVVGVLNRIVTEFDALATTHGVEKIKTIGDAYMAAGGLPVPRPDHLDRLVRMALDMQRALAALRAETGLKLHMRIGVASGPVMAGIIGCNKFSYDVWGDTVNLAARLESQSRPDRILICPNCRAKLDGRFAFEGVGRIEIKGIGEVETWLVDDPSGRRAATVRD